MLKYRFWIVALAGLCLSSGNLMAGKPTKNDCSDIPVRMSILALDAPEDTSALFGSTDGYGAVLHICSGSNDITIRSDGFADIPGNGPIGIRVPDPESVPAGVAAPDWVGGDINATGFLFNFRNMLCSGAPPASFTTRATLGFTGPDGRDYKLQFFPDVADCPAPRGIAVTDHNSPQQTSAIVVSYDPGNCATGKPQKWTVSPANPGRATLYRQEKGRNPDSHQGQYLLIFRLLFEADACLP